MNGQQVGVTSAPTIEHHTWGRAPDESPVCSADDTSMCMTSLETRFEPDPDDWNVPVRAGRRVKVAGVACLGRRSHGCSSWTPHRSTSRFRAPPALTQPPTGER